MKNTMLVMSMNYSLVHLLPKDKMYPTIVLFRTGSFTLMGSTNLDFVFESESFIKSLIERFNK